MFMSQISLYKLLFEQDLETTTTQISKAEKSTEGTEKAIQAALKPFKDEIEKTLKDQGKTLDQIAKQKDMGPKEVPTTAKSSIGATTPKKTTKPKGVGTTGEPIPRTDSGDLDIQSISQQVTQGILNDPNFVPTLAGKLSNSNSK